MALQIFPQVSGSDLLVRFNQHMQFHPDPSEPGGTTGYVQLVARMVTSLALRTITQIGLAYNFLVASAHYGANLLAKVTGKPVLKLTSNQHYTLAKKHFFFAVKDGSVTGLYHLVSVIYVLFPERVLSANETITKLIEISTRVVDEEHFAGAGAVKE